MPSFRGLLRHLVLRAEETREAHPGTVGVVRASASERESNHFVSQPTPPLRLFFRLSPIPFLRKKRNTEKIPRVQPDESIGLDSCFRCPITGEMMVDPVIDNGGHSYEREAISEWLLRSETSPITREYLSLDMLTSNRALKEAIASWSALVSRLQQRELESLSRVEEQARILRRRLFEIEGSILSANFGEHAGELGTWKEVTQG